MDVQGSRSRTGWLRGRQPDSAAHPSRPGALSPERVGQALGEWQSGELRIARSFAECRGLGHEQLEDLYQETAIVLLGRSLHNEEHLRNALRWGIKHRALHLHRDEKRRGEILAQRAPELQVAAEGREGDQTPELAALLAQDRLVVSEFLAELTELERRVFWLISEGMRYRAMAPILGVGVNEARKASRACERKRARFQLLHDTGRLCGYRSHTIQALLAGEGASEQLAQRAFAHLEGCAHCRAEHKTNARRLRRAFQEQAAALLPIPALAGHMGWLSRLDLRARELHQRLLPFGSPPGTGGMRERAIGMMISGGAAAKIAAGAATVAVLAGGTIGATHALQSNRTHHHQGASRSHSGRSTHERTAIVPPVLSTATTSVASAASGRPPSRQGDSAHRQSGGGRAEPGGFAFLGVPSGGRRRPTRARAATTTRPARTETTETEQAGTGGPFSP
jgi:RNA polymerase sigma factor (sigma-70 family)